MLSEIVTWLYEMGTWFREMVTWLCETSSYDTSDIICFFAPRHSNKSISGFRDELLETEHHHNIPNSYKYIKKQAVQTEFLRILFRRK